ncbi:MAG: terminase family protein [Rhodobacteraceae bacterium]|nr:terminase family protein [Paracoccaceae bacterium]
MLDSLLHRLSDELNPDTAPVISDAAPAVLSFRAFIERINPRYVFYDHVIDLIDALQRVADGEILNLMVFMPPRHGKSELVSRMFTAYLLYTQPEKWVAISSYAAELAYTFSRNARDNYRTAGGAVKEDAGAIKHWETGSGGGLWATGVGGPATGKGFHYGIIDDPVKNAEEAASRIIRNKHWDWWNSTWLTRQEPGAARIVVQTRWHEDDLSGRILDQLEDDPEPWHVVNMPAIKETDPRSFPECCTVIDDRREAGAALCPPRYDLDALSKIKRKDPYFWSALYQQNPSPIEGALWQRQWFVDTAFDVAPKGLRDVARDWDTAYTDDEKNSATAFVEAGQDAEGTIYVTDLDWRWLETPDAESWMLALGGAHYIERKASGKSIAQTLKRRGIAAVEVSVPGGGDKIARTSLAAPMAEAGKVRIARHLLPKLLDDEKQGILKFPNGSHNDLNDALVQAIHRLTMRAGRNTKKATSSNTTPYGY